MRILSGIDVPADLVCGSLIFARDLYDRARDRGDEVDFFALPPLDRDQSLLKYITLDANKVSSTATSYVDQIKDSVLRDLGGQPDLIHLHHLAYGMSRALIDTFPNVPKLAIAHGTDIFDAKYDSKARGAANTILAGCDHVLFPTVSLVRAAADAGVDLSRINVTVIPWGVPGAVRDRAQSNVEGHPRILVASRLTENKDVATAVRAMEVLPANYTLDIFGDGRESQPLRALILQLGLEGRVSIYDPVPRPELLERMGSYTCAIFTTADTEAFGLVGVECQAQGLPLIVSDLAVFWEVFSDSAVRYAARDSVDLARVVADLCENPAQLRTARMLGLANATRYDVDRQMARILDLGDCMVSAAPSEGEDTS